MLKNGIIRFMESDGRAIRGADGQVSKVVVVSRAKEDGRNRVSVEA